MHIIFNSSWKVGSQDILKDVSDYRLENSLILSHTDWGGSRIVSASSLQIEKTGHKIVHSDLSNEKKFYMHYFVKVGHTILQTLIPLAWILKSMPDVKIIVNVAEYYDKLKEQESLGLSEDQSLNYAKTHFELFFKMLEFYNADYEIVSCRFYKKDVIQLSNFYVFNHTPLRNSMIDSFIEVMSEMYPERNLIKPTRKVYLSRQKTWIPNLNAMPKDIPHDKEDAYYFRILKERDFQDFLESLGYEIVYAEDFESFEEQLMFMASVKELVSTTSSGLNNMLFMHPGQTIVELFTTMNMNHPSHPEAQLHDHYHALAYYRKMTYVSLPLHNKEAQSIIDNIKTNKYLRGMLND